MSSILTDIKKVLGIDDLDISFDTDIIMHTNTAFMFLNQLGVGPEEGFSITDKNKTWENFIGLGKNLESVKTYIYLQVRLTFDPPSTANVLEAATRTLKEVEWRLKVQAENNLLKATITV